MNRQEASSECIPVTVNAMVQQLRGFFMPLIKNTNELNERITFTGSILEVPNEENGWQITVVERVEVYSCWCKIKARMLKDISSEAGTILQDTINFVIPSQQSYDIMKDDLKIEWKGKRMRL